MLVCTQAGEFFKVCDFLLNASQLMIQCTKKKKTVCINTVSEFHHKKEEKKKIVR